MAAARTAALANKRLGVRGEGVFGAFYKINIYLRNKRNRTKIFFFHLDKRFLKKPPQLWVWALAAPRRPRAALPHRAPPCAAAAAPY